MKRFEVQFDREGLELWDWGDDDGSLCLHHETVYDGRFFPASHLSEEARAKLTDILRQVRGLFEDAARIVIAVPFHEEELPEELRPWWLVPDCMWWAG